MRQVGRKVEPPPSAMPSGAALAAGVAFSADLVRLAGGRVFFPKGVFRYRSHEQANAHQAACLTEGMARLHRERHGG